MDYLNARLETNRELPDLILLDLNMPLKDGRQALREIKAHPRLKGLNVIIFSTSTSEADKRQTLELGAKSFIVKPSRQDELLDTFRTICNDLGETPGWRYAIQSRRGKGDDRERD